MAPMNETPDTRPALPELDLDRIGPAVGEPFPDLSLPDQHGQMVNLHDYRDGHALLFIVHRSADW